MTDAYEQSRFLSPIGLGHLHCIRASCGCEYRCCQRQASTHRHGAWPTSARTASADAEYATAVQRLDDAEGDGERVVVKSPGGAIRVEVSSSTGDVSVFYDGSPEPLVRVFDASSGCTAY